MQAGQACVRLCMRANTDTRLLNALPMQRRASCLSRRQYLAMHFITADALLRRQALQESTNAVHVHLCKTQSALLTTKHNNIRRLKYSLQWNNRRSATAKRRALARLPGARCPLSTASLSISHPKHAGPTVFLTGKHRYHRIGRAGRVCSRYDPSISTSCYINVGTPTLLRPPHRCASNCLGLAACAAGCLEAGCPSAGASLLTRDLRRQCCTRCLSPRPTARTRVRVLSCLLRGCS